MKAICEALGFDPTNHHNAAKCPYCRPPEPQPVQSPPPKVDLGPKLFSFRSRIDWSNKARDKWKAHALTAQKTLCIDQHGRICGWGKHFITAEDESAYPVDVYLLRADMAHEIEGAKYD
jgi:hypothetical protein